MLKKRRLVFLFIVLAPTAVFSAIEGGKGQVFAGQDLHLAGAELISYQPSAGEHTLVLTGGVSMSTGADKFSSEMAVVWLEGRETRFRGRVSVDYEARVYLRGNVSVERAKRALTVGLSQRLVEDGQSMIVRFDVTGEIFVTAEKREVRDPRGLNQGS